VTGLLTDDEVIFNDDPSISNDDPVWRRIPPGWWTYDHNEGRVRPTSKNFQYSRDKTTGRKHPMSVTLGKGVEPAAALEGQPAGFKLVGWSAGHLRGHELGVCRNDQPQVLAHGLVFTLQTDDAGKRRTNLSDSVREKLSRSADWLIELTAKEVDEARRRTAAP
jgi:hypothetical protein